MGWRGSIQTEYFLGNPVLCVSVAVASTILVKVACSSSSICTWPPYPTSFSLSVAPKSLQFASTSIVCHRICPVVLVCVSFECVWSFVVVFCVVVAFCYPQSSNSLLTHSCALGCTCGCVSACCLAIGPASRKRGTCTSSVTSPLLAELSVVVLAGCQEEFSPYRPLASAGGLHSRLCPCCWVVVVEVVVGVVVIVVVYVVVLM